MQYDHIKHEQGKWNLYSIKTGKLLGSHGSKEEAEAQERAIEASKHSDTSARVQRFDRGELEKPTALDNGWLRVDGFISRTGVQVYRKADGTSWREYRPADEVFSKHTLDSFELVPLTLEHPSEGYLTADNTKRYQVGTVNQPHKQDNKTRARMLVTDAETIRQMHAGKVELSCGYSCDLEMTPGQVDGEHYDCVQRNIVGNHVAIVDTARGGPEVRLRIDSLGAEVVLSTKPTDINPEELTVTVKIKIDGVEQEVTETAAALFAKVEKTNAAALAEANATVKQYADDLAKAQAKADAAEAQNAKLKAEIAEAPKKAIEALKARSAIEVVAEKFEVKADGLSDIELKRAVAAKASGLVLEGKSDAYVEAAFEIATAAEKPVQTSPVPTHSDAGDVMEEARAKYAKSMRDAHKSAKV